MAITYHLTAKGRAELDEAEREAREAIRNGETEITQEAIREAIASARKGGLFNVLRIDAVMALRNLVDCSFVEASVAIADALRAN